MTPRAPASLAGADQLFDRCVDMSAKCGDLVAVRPRNQTTLRARMPRTGRDIVGVEQIGEAFVEDAIAWEMRRKQELLEEPSGMRAVPFGRARIGHRLHDLILGGERGRTTFGFGAHAAKRLEPDGAEHRRRGSLCGWSRRGGGDEGRVTRAPCPIPVGGGKRRHARQTLGLRTVPTLSMDGKPHLARSDMFLTSRDASTWPRLISEQPRVFAPAGSRPRRPAGRCRHSRRSRR